MKRKHASYSTDTIQHVCGFAEPTEANLQEGVDEGFRAAFAKKGRKLPHVNRYYVDLGEEQEIMASEY